VHAILVGLDASQASMVVSIAAPVTENGAESPKQSISQQGLRIEHVVGRELLDLIVSEHLVSVDGPLTRDPSVNFLIQDAFLGQLVINIGLRGDLKGRMSAVRSVHLVRVVGVTDGAAERPNLV